MFVLFINDIWFVDVLWGKFNVLLIVIKDMVEVSVKLVGLLGVCLMEIVVKLFKK